MVIVSNVNNAHGILTDSKNLIHRLIKPAGLRESEEKEIVCSIIIPFILLAPMA